LHIVKKIHTVSFFIFVTSTFLELVPASNVFL